MWLEERDGASFLADVQCPAVNSAGRKFVLIEEVDHGSNDVGSVVGTKTCISVQKEQIWPHVGIQQDCWNAHVMA